MMNGKVKMDLQDYLDERDAKDRRIAELEMRLEEAEETTDKMLDFLEEAMNKEIERILAGESQESWFMLTTVRVEQLLEYIGHRYLYETKKTVLQNKIKERQPSFQD